jgi:hypothetical protein
LAGRGGDAEIAQRRAVIDDDYGAKPGPPAYVRRQAQSDAARIGPRAAVASGGAAADPVSRRAASRAILKACFLIMINGSSPN